jgi:hypothetical protein
VNSLRLSATQIERLLSFYHSDVGQRYLAFQKRLMTAQVQGSNALLSGLNSGGVDPKEVEVSPVSPGELEERKKLLSSSWIIKVTPAMGLAGSPSLGKDASADKAVADVIVDSVATTRGAEIDALDGQYKSDLAAFSAFQESPAAKALIAVYGDYSRDALADKVNPGTGFITALQQSVGRHTPAWKAIDPWRLWSSAT